MRSNQATTEDTSSLARCRLLAIQKYIFWYTYNNEYICKNSSMGSTGIWPNRILSHIARFMGPTWCPPGADRTQVGPVLAPWTMQLAYNVVVIISLHNRPVADAGSSLDRLFNPELLQWKFVTRGWASFIVVIIYETAGCTYFDRRTQRKTTS